MFGKPDLETQLDFADFLNVFAHQSYLASQLHVSWFARWIPTPSWFKYCQNADFLYGQIREFAKFQSSSPNSFSVYSELSKIYGEDRAVSICYDLNSSSLRTGLATWWLLYDVARFSDVQSRLKKEFQEVPEYSDRKFLHAVLKESYRVHPLQLVQAKRVTEETKIGGYEIPADTVHSSLTGLTAKSEKYFNEPLQFLPDRWLDGSKIHPFASTPFGAGSRKCPGETVANLQISILLERVLQAFELDADPTEVAEAQYGPLLTPVLPLDIAFKSIRSSDDAESGDEDIS